MYNVYAKVYGVDVIEIKGDAPDYKITVEQIKDVIPKVKVLILDNPKSHLPNHFTHKELHTIIGNTQVIWSHNIEEASKNSIIPLLELDKLQVWKDMIEYYYFHQSMQLLLLRQEIHYHSQEEYFEQQKD